GSVREKQIRETGVRRRCRRALFALLPDGSRSVRQIRHRLGTQALLREDMKLKGKVALITGAGSGIGRQTALLFAREGAAIGAVDVNEKAAQETVGMINNAIAVKADVSKAADAENMVAQAEKKFGKLHVLFNNAGIMHSKDDDAMSTPEEVWD